MRKPRLYIRIFWFSGLLATIAIGIALFVSEKLINNLQTTIIGAVLGFGLTISVARNFDSLAQHKRRKRTLGMIKLVAIPYLKNRAQNIQDLANGARDICDIEEATALIKSVSHLDILASSTDKEWLQLIYSQEFLDSLNSDDHFNAIAAAIFEVMLYIDQLASQSAIAKSLVSGRSTFTPDDQAVLINHAKEVRNSLGDTAVKFAKHVDELDRQISKFLSINGTHHEERDR